MNTMKMTKMYVNLIRCQPSKEVLITDIRLIKCWNVENPTILSADIRTGELDKSMVLTVRG